MGLAGRKEKRKLNEDPNNTKWSRNEATFGQKILRAQGWEPGQYLGAQDAAHASMHSAASSAPIKVVLKDDTLGLGAKIRQKQADDCTGLDVFKDLLGRLNGESDESIAQKQAVRSELKTSLWVEQRFGSMRFVRGGLLVGDKINELVKEAADAKQAAKDVATTTDSSEEAAAESKSGKKEKKSKKRKAEDADATIEPETGDAEVKKKRKKRSKDESATESGQEQAASDDDEAERKRRKKEKKEKKAKAAEELAGSADESKSKSKKDKKDKKRRKEAKAEGSAETVDDSESSKKKEKKKKKQKLLEAAETVTATPADVVVITATPAASGTSTPAGTGTSTPQPMSRHMVRSRNIASKRMAMTDMAALQQIFMVKPV